MAFDLNNLNEIDFNSIGTLPAPVRAVMIGIVCVLVLVLGYFLDIKGKMEELETFKQTEQTLRQDFEEKQNKAVNLEAYKAQMKDMEESFGMMLRQLPSKTEVADLLIDVTQTGLAAGLTFELFKPEKEIPLDFYAELPITIEVSGKYHDFGVFVSGVAALPRIVTLHNLAISKKDKGGTLVMKGTAKTYRYLDAQEIAAAAQSRAKTKQGR